MNEEFKALLNGIKTNQQDFSVDEAKTKQGSILPILNFLKWNVFDTSEVVPEYSVESKKVDYSLRIQSKNKVFLEAKKASEDLEKHQEQLLNYSFREGVELAILTNGITWWFYLPLEKGNWEQRKFFTVDLNEQDLDDCAEKFESLLSKKNVSTEIAYQNAKRLFESRQKNKIIKENLPKAWQKLISEPDELLVELLNDTLEKVCGYKADESVIVDFLHHNSSNFDFPTSTSIKITKILNSKGKRIKSELPKDLIEKDTIVVPAQEEGFVEEFLGNNCWYAIRINSKMIPKIKYIAAYRVSPISSITHIAKVKKIELYENTNKYILYFSGKAEEIRAVKLGKLRGKAPQSPIYSVMNKIKNAKTLDDIF